MENKCFICLGPYPINNMVFPNGQRVNICINCTFMDKPKIICLCGSTRFFEEFAKANMELTLAGNIVLSIGCDTHHVDADYTEEQKRGLDRLHKQKINMADEVLVLNKDGYIGESTKSEIEFALSCGIVVKYKYEE